MVYERKRKIATSESWNSELACNGKFGDHADKDNQEYAVEKPNASTKMAATVSDSSAPGTTKQHNSNHNEINKLLLLSEVCIMVETSNQEKASGKSIAELCESQKNEVALKKDGKEPLSCGPKQGADNTPPSSSINMIGQNQTTPICSSQLKNGATSGTTDRGETIIPIISRSPLGFLKYTTKMYNWSALELDALWIGVRRYGQHNWSSILADPRMYILKKRTPQELATKWNEEKNSLKISLPVINTVLPIPTTCAKTINALGPGIGRFPLGVDNEALRRRWSNMLLSKNQGSASSFNSIQRSASATASATAQRLKAIQTSAELNVSTKRQECSTANNVEP